MLKRVKECGRERKERQKREKQCGREVQVVGNESTWLSKPLSDDDLSWNKKKKKNVINIEALRPLYWRQTFLFFLSPFLSGL